MGDCEMDLSSRFSDSVNLQMRPGTVLAPIKLSHARRRGSLLAPIPSRDIPSDIFCGQRKIEDSDSDSLAATSGSDSEDNLEDSQSSPYFSPPKPRGSNRDIFCTSVPLLAVDTGISPALTSDESDNGSPSLSPHFVAHRQLGGEGLSPVRPSTASIQTKSSPFLPVIGARLEAGSAPATPQRKVRSSSKQLSLSSPALSAIEEARRLAMEAYTSAGGDMGDLVQDPLSAISLSDKSPMTKVDKPIRRPRVATFPAQPLDPIPHSSCRENFSFHPKEDNESTLGLLALAQALGYSISNDTQSALLNSSKSSATNSKGSPNKLFPIPAKSKFTPVKRGWQIKDCIPHTIEEDSGLGCQSLDEEF
eukprot:gene6100-6717_t